jgi:RHS repeat-associated protein
VIARFRFIEGAPMSRTGSHPSASSKRRALVIAFLVAGGCSRPVSDPGAIENRPASLTGSVVVTVVPNGWPEPICFWGRPETCTGDSWSKTWNLPPGTHAIAAWGSSKSATLDDESLGLVTVDPMGVVSLDDDAKKFLTLSSGQGGPTLTVTRVVPVTLDAGRYAGPSCIGLGTQYIGEKGPGSQATMMVIPGRYYAVSDICTRWTNDQLPGIFVDDHGQVSPVDQAAWPMVSAQGTTVRLTTFTDVTVDVTGYQDSWGDYSDIYTNPSTYSAAAPLTRTVALLPAHSYWLLGVLSRDPSTDNDIFGPNYEMDLHIDALGKISVGGVYSQYFTVQGTSVSPIVRQLRVFRDGYGGRICAIYPNGLDEIRCAPDDGDLDLKVIPGRKYFVGSSAGATTVMVNSDGTCAESSISLAGQALRVGCGKTEVAPLTAPALYGTLTSATQVALSWPAVSGAQSLKLWRSVDGAAYTTLTTPAVTATSFNDSTVASGKTYAYRLDATNGFGTVSSNVLTVKVAVPPAPTNLRGEVASTTSVKLSWDFPPGAETGFKIQRSPDNSTWTTVKTAGRTPLSYTNTGLTNGSTYWYRVRATSALGDGALSTAISITVAKPAPPTMKGVTMVSPNQIDVSWTATSNNESDFKIERQIVTPSSTGAFGQVGTVAAGVPVFSDRTALQPGNTYNYRVRAHNGVNDSSYSAVAGVTISMPAAPVLTGTAAPGRVNLSWTDVSGETGYAVQRFDGTDFAPLRTLAAGSTSYSDDEATANASNRYRVLALSPGGNAISNEVSVTPGGLVPCGGGGPACLEAGFTQFNHNLLRIEYRADTLPQLSGAVVVATLASDPSNGEMPDRPRGRSCVGSRVDDLRWSFAQDSADFTTGMGAGDVGGCGAAASEAGRLPSLQVRRYHRPRLEYLGSSFGPGVFSNFDARIAFHRVGFDGHPSAELADPETDAPPLTLFERSEADGDGADDGVFRDSETRTYRRLVLYGGSAPSEANRVSAASQAALAVLERHDGGAVWFEPIATNAGDPGLIEARPIAYLDRNGNKFAIQYQFARTATDAQLGYDRGQLWKISKVTDSLHQHTVTFAYEHRVSGRWLVKTVTATLADGSTRVHTYTYADTPSADALIEVKYPNLDTSVFSRTYDATTQLWGLTYDDIGQGGSKLKKTVWVTGTVFKTADGMPRATTPNLVRKVVNADGEEVLRLSENPNDPNVTFAVEGGRALWRLSGDQRGAPREAARALSVPADPMTATFEAFETYQTAPTGVLTAVTDATGKTRTLTRDPKTQWVTGLAARDGTSVSWTLGAYGNPTHQVDRSARATDATYDVHGNLLSATVAPGTSLAAASHFTYNAAGQVLSQEDPLGHVTSYAYDAKGYLSSVAEPADVAGGARATSSFVTGALGLQSEKVDASGHRITYQYDTRGRLVSTTYPDGTTETITYGTRFLGGLAVSRKDRNGNVESYEYDNTRRLKKIIRASNRAEKLEEIFEYVPGTELVSAATVGGERTEYDYDQRNREITRRKYTAAGKILTWQRSYDAADRLVSETDPYGRKTFKVNDLTGQVVRVVRELVPGGVSAGADLTALPRVLGGNPLYVITDVALDGMGRTLSRTDERGMSTTSTYDAAGRVTEQIEAAGSPVARTTRFAYDVAGNRTKISKPRTFSEGHPFETAFTFTGRNLPASETQAAGTADAATTGYTYTPTRQIATVTDPRGGVTTTTRDSNDRPQSIKDAAGFTTTYAYDGLGNQTSMTNALGQATTRTWDGQGRLLTERNPAGETTTFQYDDDLTDGVGLSLTYQAQLAGLGLGPKANGRGTLRTNPAGETTFTAEDGVGRTVLVVDGTGSATRTTFDVVVGGLVEVSVTDPLSITRRVRRDALERDVVAVDALGKVTSRSFDPVGNLVATRNPNGVGQDCTYDELGQETACTDTAGDTRRHERDAAGNLTATVDGAGARATCTYDARDRAVSCKDANGATTTSTYDQSGNLTALTDAEGGVTRYTYDARGLQTTVTFPDSTSSTDKQTYAYDGAGRLVSRTLQNGNVITLSYDAAGRLTTRAYPDAKNDTFGYDLASRLKSSASARYGATVNLTWDKAGRLSKESLVFQTKTYDVSNTYDAAGRLTKLSYPDASEVNRTYTTRAQLATLALGTRAIASYAYDDGGRLTTTTFGNGMVETRGYRADDRLQAVSTPDVGDFSYAYDQAKRKTSEGGTAAPGGVQSFSYDAAGRLTSWARGSENQSWRLSPSGDWSSTSRGGVTETRTHNAAHELTKVGAAALSYTSRGDIQGDDLGNKLAVDYESRLQTFTRPDGTVVSFFYDAVGRKVAKTVTTSSSATTTVFVHAGEDTVAEYVGGTFNLSYVMGARADDVVALAKAGKLYWYSRNSLGTVSAVTDEAKAVKERYRYTAFGARTILSSTGSVLTASTVGNPVGFTGRYHDSDTGLLDFRARHYDARLGRFVSRDDQYRNGLNLYSAYYVPNATDPTGHAAQAVGPILVPLHVGFSGSLGSDPRRSLLGRLSCPFLAKETAPPATTKNPGGGDSGSGDGKTIPKCDPNKEGQTCCKPAAEDKDSKGDKNGYCPCDPKYHGDFVCPGGAGGGGGRGSQTVNPGTPANDNGQTKGNNPATFEPIDGGREGPAGDPFLPKDVCTGYDGNADEKCLKRFVCLHFKCERLVRDTDNPGGLEGQCKDAVQADYEKCVEDIDAPLWRRTLEPIAEPPSSPHRHRAPNQIIPNPGPVPIIILIRALLAPLGI